MGAFGIVISYPARNSRPSMGQAMEQRFIQKLIPHPAIKTFHETILHGLAGGDVMPLDQMIGTPAEDGIGG